MKGSRRGSARESAYGEITFRSAILINGRGGRAASMHGAMGERSRARANLAFASLERGLSVLIDRRHRVLLARGASLCGLGERAPSPRATGLIIPRPERNGEMRVRNALVNGQRARRGFEEGREAKF